MLKLNMFPRFFLFLIVSFLVAYPISMLVIGSFRSEMIGLPGIWGLSGWKQAYSNPDFIPALITTVQLAISKTVVCVGIAIVFAWFVNRTNMPMRRIIDNFLHIAFFILPPLPVLLGWVLLLAPKSGLINQWFIDLFGGPLFNIFSKAGIVFVMSAGLLPFYYIFLSPAFKSMDLTLEESARVSGASSFATIRKITLPLMLPAIFGLVMFSMIRGMEAFETPLFLGSHVGIKVLATHIYDYIDLEPPLFAPALATGVTLLAVTFALVMLQWKILGRREYFTVTGKGYKPNTIDLGRWRWPIFILLATILGSISIPPMFILIQTTFMKVAGMYDLPDGIYTLRNYKMALSRPEILFAIRNTAIVGISSATISTLSCTLVAYVIVKTKFIERKALEVIAWFPVAVPGIVMGLALLWVWIAIKPFGISLYGTLPLLIICFVTIGFPIGTRIMSSAVIQIHDSLEESAWVCGASWGRSFFCIWLPLLKNGLMTTWILNFSASVRVLAPVILIYGPDSRVISTTFFELYKRGNLEAASVIGVIESLMIIAAWVFIKMLGKLSEVKFSRLFKQ